MERLQKVIAASGLVSRRAAEKLITEGKVAVNEEVVRQLGTTIDSLSDIVTIAGKPLPRRNQVSYLWYKPKGVVCSRRRQGREQIVADFFPKNTGLYSIGRLDRESEGLLLVSNDGELTYKLTHPSFQHEKEYVAYTNWKKDRPQRSPTQLTDMLRHGLKLGDGLAKADRVSFQLEKDGGLEMTIVVHEGRHHLIRRMCAVVGLDVKRLIRIRMGNLKIGNLKPGEFQKLDQKDVELLHV